MPIVLRLRGYRFFFFSREGLEPPHIHVEKDDRYAKFWLEPVALARAKGFRSFDLAEIRDIILTNRDLFVERWNEHFTN